MKNRKVRLMKAAVYDLEFVCSGMGINWSQQISNISLFMPNKNGANPWNYFNNRFAPTFAEQYIKAI